MAAPIRIDSPEIELTSTRNRRGGTQALLAVGSFVLFMIAMNAAFLPNTLSVVAALLWLAGPGRAMLPPKQRIFPGKPGSIEASKEGGLVFSAGNAQQTILAHEITEARLHPLEKRIDLRLNDNKIVTAKVAAFEDVERALDAIGLDPQKRTYVARLGPEPAASNKPWIAAALVSLAVGILIGIRASVDVGFWLFPVIATIVFHLTRRALAPAELSAASSGLTLETSGSRQLFHYGGLRDVRLEADRLRIFTDDGRETSAEISSIDEADRTTIEGWVQTRRQTFASSAASTDAFTALDRHGRSLEAWREALRGVLHQEGQYRRAPITVEDVSRLLTNPHTPAERRIAAAFILSETRTAVSEKQIRFAAESSASQPMRIALRALADEKIEAEAIEEAIEAETGSLAR